MKKIFIVDDEPGVIMVLGRFLARLKYEIVSATNGLEAIKIIKESNDLAVAIIDLRMPEISGIEIIKEAMMKRIPVVVISGVLETDPLIEAVKKMGFSTKDNILFKPIDPYKLLDIIKLKLQITG